MELNFLDTEAGRKAVIDFNTKRTNDRRAVMEARKRQTAEYIAKRDAAQARLDEAKGRYDAALRSVKDRAAEMNQAQGVVSGITGAHQVAQMQHDRRLLESVPTESIGAIEAFRAEMDTLHLHDRRRGFHSETRGTGQWFRTTGKEEMQVWNNAASLERRLSAIRDAQQQALLLPLTLTDVSLPNVLRELGKLRASLPVAEVEAVTVITQAAG